MDEEALERVVGLLLGSILLELPMHPPTEKQARGLGNAQQERTQLEQGTLHWTDTHTRSLSRSLALCRGVAVLLADTWKSPAKSVVSQTEGNPLQLLFAVTVCPTDHLRAPLALGAYLALHIATV